MTEEDAQPAADDTGTGTANPNALNRYGDAVDVNKPPPPYVAQECALTLREGLEAHYAANPGLFDPETLEEPAKSLFFRHDCVHVMFGLTTALEDETLADSWTFFAVDIPILRYAKYLSTPEVKKLITSLPISAFIVPVFRALPRVWRAFWRSRRMTPWHWEVNDDDLDTPIRELRARHGIQVV